jgi:hypothetical protein
MGGISESVKVARSGRARRWHGAGSAGNWRSGMTGGSHLLAREVGPSAGGTYIEWAS